MHTGKVNDRYKQMCLLSTSTAKECLTSTAETTRKFNEEREVAEFGNLEVDSLEGERLYFRKPPVMHGNPKLLLLQMLGDVCILWLLSVEAVDYRKTETSELFSSNLQIG